MTRAKPIEIPWADGTLTSEYKYEYIKKRADQQEKHPRKGIIHPLIESKAKFQGVSAAQEAFKKHPLGRLQSCRPVTVPIRDRKFQTETSYNKEFTGKEFPQGVHKKDNTFASFNGQFSCETTSKTDYPKWPNQTTDAIVPKWKAVPEAKFTNSTVYKGDFRPWDSQHQGPIRPKKSTPLHLPTGGTSGYRTDFPDHNVVASGVALPKERKRIEIPWAPGALGTEYLAQYREKTGNCVVKGRKDPKGLVPSKAELKGISASTLDYPNWAAQPMRKSTKKPQKPVCHRTFQGSTTYNHEFTNKDMGQAISSNHTNMNLIKSAYDPSGQPFKGESTTHTDYPVWNSEPRKSLRPADHPVPIIKNTHTSLYHDEYLNWEPVRAPPRKNEGCVPSIQFVNQTSYANDFCTKNITGTAISAHN